MKALLVSSIKSLAQSDVDSNQASMPHEHEALMQTRRNCCCCSGVLLRHM